MTNHTDRFLAIARRQRLHQLRELAEALAVAGLTCVAFLGLL